MKPALQPEQLEQAAQHRDGELEDSQCSGSPSTLQPRKCRKQSRCRGIELDRMDENISPAAVAGIVGVSSMASGSKFVYYPKCMIYIYIVTCVDTCIHAHIHTCIHTRAYIHMQTHRHTYIHIYISTYLHTDRHKDR